MCAPNMETLKIQTSVLATILIQKLKSVNIASGVHANSAE